MYSRYPNYRFSGGMKVPENYSGNAFKASEETAEEEKNTESSDLNNNNIPEPSAPIEESTDIFESPKSAESLETLKTVEKGIRLPKFKFDIGKLFSGRFEFEELLIIGIILLISQNGTDDDIILLLALLLFIK